MFSAGYMKMPRPPRPPGMRGMRMPGLRHHGRIPSTFGGRAPVGHFAGGRRGAFGASPHNGAVSGMGHPFSVGVSGMGSNNFQWPGQASASGDYQGGPPGPTRDVEIDGGGGMGGY